MKQLLYSALGENDLVPFHLRRRKIELKCEKVYKDFFHDCLKIFLSVLTSLKIRGNFGNDQFFVEGSKSST